MIWSLKFYYFMKIKNNVWQKESFTWWPTSTSGNMSWQQLDLEKIYFYLQEACIDYICDNISSLCNSVWTDGGEQKLQFKEEEIFFHTELSEQLLVRLCEKKKLDDLTLTLFQVRNKCGFMRFIIFNTRVTPRDWDMFDCQMPQNWQSRAWKLWRVTKLLSWKHWVWPKLLLQILSGIIVN